MVSLVNSHSNATSRRWHLWEIDLRFALGLPPGWFQAQRQGGAGKSHLELGPGGEVVCAPGAKPVPVRDSRQLRRQAVVVVPGAAHSVITPGNSLAEQCRSPARPCTVGALFRRASPTQQLAGRSSPRVANVAEEHALVSVRIVADLADRHLPPLPRSTFKSATATIDSCSTTISD